MTKKNKNRINEHQWYKLIKIKNLPVQICSKDKEHKYIRTHKYQKMCLFCEWGRMYPPPAIVNQGDDGFDYLDTLPVELGVWS